MVRSDEYPHKGTCIPACERPVTWPWSRCGSQLFVLESCTGRTESPQSTERPLSRRPTVTQAGLCFGWLAGSGQRELWFGATRRGCRSGTVAPPVRRVPPHGPVRVPGQAPSELVDQLVVPMAHQHQVPHLGGPAGRPPPDVVGPGPPALPAPREGAPTVAVPQLAHHPLRGVPGHPRHAHQVAGGVLHDPVEPAVAEQPHHGIRRDDPAGGNPAPWPTEDLVLTRSGGEPQSSWAPPGRALSSP